MELYHGSMIEISETDLPYKKIMCEMINQAIDYALKRRWSNIMAKVDRDVRRKWVTAREQAEAIAYILSIGFEADCDLVGLPDDFVYRVREMVQSQREWQYPLELKAEVVSEYNYGIG